MSRNLTGGRFSLALVAALVIFSRVVHFVEQAFDRVAQFLWDFRWVLREQTDYVFEQYRQILIDIETDRRVRADSEKLHALTRARELKDQAARIESAASIKHRQAVFETEANIQAAEGLLSPTQG
jgi:hypothetical protein